MAKKGEYALNMDPPEYPMKVKGDIYGNFGIDKRESNYFVLTHIPSGRLVCSAKKKKELVELLEDEEFSEDYWKEKIPEKENIKKLAKVITKFYSK